MTCFLFHQTCGLPHTTTVRTYQLLYLLTTMKPGNISAEGGSKSREIYISEICLTSFSLTRGCRITFFAVITSNKIIHVLNEDEIIQT